MLLPAANTRLHPFEWGFAAFSMLCSTRYPSACSGKGVLTPQSPQLCPVGASPTWPHFSYHFSVLQTLGLVTGGSLSNMLCPATSDPFHGPWYRIWASGQQALTTVTHGKLVIPFHTWLGPCVNICLICSGSSQENRQKVLSSSP